MPHPLNEFADPIVAKMRVKYRYLEPAPFEEACMALSPPKRDGSGEQMCKLLWCHKGPHDWEHKS